MSLPQTHADTPAVPPVAPSPARSLIEAVAKAIAEAEPGRRYGCYDYSSAGIKDRPYIIRDESVRGRIIWRSDDHAATQTEYRRLTGLFVAVKALEAIHEWSHQ